MRLRDCQCERETRVPDVRTARRLVPNRSGASSSSTQSQARVPTPEIVWWRAQMRAREEAARDRRAAYPVFTQALAVAALVGLLVSVLGRLTLPARCVRGPGILMDSQRRSAASLPIAIAGGLLARARARGPVLRVLRATELGRIIPARLCPCTNLALCPFNVERRWTDGAPPQVACSVGVLACGDRALCTGSRPRPASPASTTASGLTTPATSAAGGIRRSIKSTRRISTSCRWPGVSRPTTSARAPNTSSRARR